MPLDKNKWTAADLRSFVSRRKGRYYRVGEEFRPSNFRVGRTKIRFLIDQERPSKGSHVRFSVDGDRDIGRYSLLQCLDHIIRVCGPNVVIWEKEQTGSGSNAGAGESSKPSDGSVNSTHQEGASIGVISIGLSDDGTENDGSGEEAIFLKTKPCAASASNESDRTHSYQDLYQQSSSIQDISPCRNVDSSVSEKSGDPASSSGSQKEGTDPLDRFWGKVAEGFASPKTNRGSELSDTLDCDGSSTDRESSSSDGFVKSKDLKNIIRDKPEAKDHSGGQYTDKDRVNEARSKIETRARKEIYRALTKLLKAVDIGGIDPSPRLEGSKLVKEIVYQRYSLARTKRDELEKSIAFLCVDNSGSCSACCDEMLATALEIQRENPEKFIVILHSNGAVEREMSTEDYEHLYKTIARLGKGKNIAAVVAFGDWDAGSQYKRIAESGVPLIWLDHQSEDMPCRMREGLRPDDWKINPAFHWDGVHDPKTTAIAFRDMARQIRRGK